MFASKILMSERDSQNRVWTIGVKTYRASILQYFIYFLYYLMYEQLMTIVLIIFIFYHMYILICNICFACILHVNHVHWLCTLTVSIILYTSLVDYKYINMDRYRCFMIWHAQIGSWQKNILFFKKYNSNKYISHSLFQIFKFLFFFVAVIWLPVRVCLLSFSKAPLHLGM